MLALGTKYTAHPAKDARGTAASRRAASLHAGRHHRPLLAHIALAIDAFHVHREAPQAGHVLEHLARGVVQGALVVLMTCQVLQVNQSSRRVDDLSSHTRFTLDRCIPEKLTPADYRTTQRERTGIRSRRQTPRSSNPRSACAQKNQTSSLSSVSPRATTYSGSTAT